MDAYPLRESTAAASLTDLGTPVDAAIGAALRRNRDRRSIMDDVTRRAFVKTSAGAAALAAAGTIGVADADARGHQHDHPIVAWIRDPRDGKITVMSGNNEVTIRDRELVRRIARAAR